MDNKQNNLIKVDFEVEREFEMVKIPVYTMNQLSEKHKSGEINGVKLNEKSNNR